jgi:hypothetical protein
MAKNCSVARFYDPHPPAASQGGGVKHRFCPHHFPNWVFDDHQNMFATEQLQAISYELTANDYFPFVRW